METERTIGALIEVLYRPMTPAPTLETIREDIAGALREAVEKLYGFGLERVVLERPPKVSLGDFATPTAFDLAKKVRKAPRAIASEIAAAAVLPAGVREARVEGGGYLNFFVHRSEIARGLLGEPAPRPRRDGKVIVEHTNINPNKAAHIGHLRNALLGDVLVRALRYLGHEVEVQNYLDDTGVQVADVVAGLLHLSGVASERQMADVIATATLPGGERNPKGFAYLCWDLYAEVGRTYKARPETQAWRTEVLHAIEAGDNETAAIAAAVSEAVSSAHLATMGRIGIAYDLLPRESDILRRNFWGRAFERLKTAGAVALETEGKHAGCWVRRLSESEEFAGLEEPDKILVRSNGTVTYTAKDIAYQLWKFGLLGADFDYERFAPDWNSGSVTEEEIPQDVRRHAVWRTAHGAGEPGAPKFGGAARVFNVIDVRQSYTQKVVKEGLRVLGYPREAEASNHFSYEIVALSPKAARQLAERFGEEYRLTPEDEKKPFVEMSGRKGLGVKADDLVEMLLDRSRAEVASRREKTEASEAGNAAQAAEVDARSIAVGALRYFLLKFGRNKVIAFDFDEAVSFEGDTGPYLQYSLVRAGNIFRKLAERKIAAEVSEADLAGAEWEDDLWAVLLEAASTPDVAERAVAALEPSTLARHAFSLAQAFNQFYHRHPIAQEADAALRNRRLAVARIFAREMTRLLGLLGIPEPGRM
jgi:arginyl-tRNA synthetase